MGIARTWRSLKALKAVGQAANEAAARNTPGGTPQRGFAAGFANVLTEAMAPRMAATAERRGGPLPGSDAAVVDRSAWARPVADGAAALRTRDAAFDPGLLETFAGQVFGAVVAVWAGGDAASVRPVFSDTLWEPLAAATGMGMHRDFMLLRCQQVTPELTGLHAGAWYDSALVVMHVRLDFASQALPADLASKLPAEMPAEMQQWDEDWLFQRSAQPGGDPMIRPAACPTCGAPTRVDQAGVCTHCRVPEPFLTSGWLVTGIVSHHPSHARTRQALAEQLRADPTLAQRIPPQWTHLLSPERTGDDLQGPRPGPAP
jgi:hypothetical protein